MGRVPFITGEIYHLYNHGVEDRWITEEPFESNRFERSLLAFNTVTPVGSLYELSFQQEKNEEQEYLVDVIAYCLNPNHFHLLVKQRVDYGVGEFLRRVVGGYTLFYNERRKNRDGPLVKGRTKARRIETNEELLQMGAYVNLNDRVHQLGGRTSKLVRSSMPEYTGTRSSTICNPHILLSQFTSPKHYTRDANRLLKEVLHRRQRDKALASLTIEKVGI